MANNLMQILEGAEDIWRAVWQELIWPPGDKIIGRTGNGWYDSKMVTIWYNHDTSIEWGWYWFGDIGNNCHKYNSCSQLQLEAEVFEIGTWSRWKVWRQSSPAKRGRNGEQGRHTQQCSSAQGRQTPWTRRKLGSMSYFSNRKHHCF